MDDFRPVGQVIGRLTVALGLSMLIPTGLDWFDGNGNWQGFLLAAFLSTVTGLALAAASAGHGQRGLTRQQAFLVTTLVWVVLPFFGGLPFIAGHPSADFTDAYFEAMSAITTTGATVFTGLDTAPRGFLLWRGMMQWFGGVGILVVAIVFLPALRVGGMQFFRSEAFDLSGDIVPRATQIAGQLTWIYVILTALCMGAYSASGMNGFDALVHAMTTMPTGGMANYDAGFGVFPAASHWVGTLFMILAALPFIRFIQLSGGRAAPLFRDRQVQAFLGIVLGTTAIVTAWLVVEDHHPFEAAVREASFNLVSIMTGTGYASDPYDKWGGLPVTLFFILALIGGCTGSTSCSAKIFRYQVLWIAMVGMIRRIHAPHTVHLLRYQGRVLEPEVISSVMSFFFVFFVALSVWSILLSLLGLDPLTAMSGAVAALCNVGPGLGPVIGPSGNFVPLSDAAIWLLSFGMLLGRLEFLSVLVLFTPMFWRR